MGRRGDRLIRIGLLVRCECGYFSVLVMALCIGTWLEGVGLSLASDEDVEGEERRMAEVWRVDELLKCC